MITVVVDIGSYKFRAGAFNCDGDLLATESELSDSWCYRDSHDIAKAATSVARIVRSLEGITQQKAKNLVVVLSYPQVRSCVVQVTTSSNSPSEFSEEDKDATKELLRRDFAQRRGLQPLEISIFEHKHHSVSHDPLSLSPNEVDVKCSVLFHKSSEHAAWLELFQQIIPERINISFKAAGSVLTYYSSPQESSSRVKTPASYMINNGFEADTGLYRHQEKYSCIVDMGNSFASCYIMSGDACIERIETNADTSVLTEGIVQNAPLVLTDKVKKVYCSDTEGYGDDIVVDTGSRQIVLSKRHLSTVIYENCKKLFGDVMQTLNTREWRGKLKEFALVGGSAILPSASWIADILSDYNGYKCNVVIPSYEFKGKKYGPEWAVVLAGGALYASGRKEVTWWDMLTIRHFQISAAIGMASGTIYLAINRLGGKIVPGFISIAILAVCYSILLPAPNRRRIIEALMAGFAGLICASSILPAMPAHSSVIQSTLMGGIAGVTGALAFCTSYMLYTFVRRRFF